MLWREGWIYPINTSQNIMIAETSHTIMLIFFISSSPSASVVQQKRKLHMCTGINILRSASVVGVISLFYHSLAFLMVHTVKHWQHLCSFVAKCLHQYVSRVLSWSALAQSWLMLDKWWFNRLNIQDVTCAVTKNMFGESSGASFSHHQHHSLSLWTAWGINSICGQRARSERKTQQVNSVITSAEQCWIFENYICYKA